MPEARSTLTATVPHVLYIMGTARSGTTILQVLLARSPGCGSHGELTHLFEDAFVADRLCSCGAPASHCPFWSRIRAALRGDAACMKERARLVRSVDWHSAFPWLALGVIPGARMKKYGALQDDLIRALAEADHVATIVDDSIYPGRAVALDRCFPGRLSAICLTRDPRGLLAAFSRPNRDEQRPKSTLAVVLYYGYVVLCLRIALWRLRAPVLRITFEELRGDPEGVLRRIGEWSGQDVSGVLEDLRADAPFAVGHVVTGNRLRKEGAVHFQRGEPAAELSASQRAAALIMDAVRWLLRL